MDVIVYPWEGVFLLDLPLTWQTIVYIRACMLMAVYCGITTAVHPLVPSARAPGRLKGGTPFLNGTAISGALWFWGFATEGSGPWRLLAIVDNFRTKANIR